MVFFLFFIFILFLDKYFDKQIKNTSIKIERKVSEKKNVSKKDVKFKVIKKYEKKQIIPTIIIDPAHGGDDLGFIGRDIKNNIIQEKDINIKISQMLANKLRSMGINVYLVRKSDYYLSLEDRFDLVMQHIVSNDYVKMYLSINMGYSRNINNRGFGVFAYSVQKTNEELNILDNYGYQTFDSGFISKNRAIIEKENYILARLIKNFNKESILINTNIVTKRLYLKSLSMYSDIPALALFFGYLSNKKDLEIANKKQRVDQYLGIIVKTLSKIVFKNKNKEER